jgi:hypothetical protein
MASGSTSRNWDEFRRKERLRTSQAREGVGASVGSEELAQARTALLNGFRWLSEESLMTRLERRGAAATASERSYGSTMACASARRRGPSLRSGFFWRS